MVQKYTRALHLCISCGLRPYLNSYCSSKSCRMDNKLTFCAASICAGKCHKFGCVQHKATGFTGVPAYARQLIADLIKTQASFSLKLFVSFNVVAVYQVSHNQNHNCFLPLLHQLCSKLLRVVLEFHCCRGAHDEVLCFRLQSFQARFRASGCPVTDLINTLYEQGRRLPSRLTLNMPIKALVRLSSYGDDTCCWQSSVNA